MSPFLTIRSRFLQALILLLMGLTFYTYHKSTEGEIHQFAFVKNNNSHSAFSALVYEPVRIISNASLEIPSTPVTKNLSLDIHYVNINASHNPSNNISTVITVLLPSSNSQTMSSLNSTISSKMISSSSTSSPPTIPIIINKDSARAIYNPGHTVTISEKCPDFGKNMELMIAIMSAPSHIEARTAIRQTWGHYGQRKDIGIIFMLGDTADNKFEKNLQREQDIYGDIVRGRFIDSYTNLTLKTISTLEWVDVYCPEVRFVLKTDDDMFINVPRLVSFIHKHKNDRNVIFGKLARKWKPIRNKSSKYYLSVAQYKKPVFPDFTTGPAYLLSNDVIHKLYEAALNETFIKLEDVFMTGIVAHNIGIRRIHANEFLNRRIPYSPCNIQRGISIHMVKYSEQFDLWKKLLDGKTKC